MTKKTILYVAINPLERTKNVKHSSETRARPSCKPFEKKEVRRREAQ